MRTTIALQPTGWARMAAALVLGLAAMASGSAWGAAVDEAGVRAALERCVAGWNSHEPQRFGECLTEDVWFSEADDSFYQRFRGRPKVLGLMDYSIRNSDLRWEVVRLHAQPDGTVAVQLRQSVGMLPVKDGRHAMRFDSDPSFARLRREGAVWKLHFFTSDAGWARALLAKLEAPPAAPASAPASASKTPAIERPGAAPAAYSMPFGTGGMSCHYCHGLPALADDSARTRILTEGVAAADGAALRRQMAQPRTGGMMDKVLADPALTDADLERIRRWLLTLRDGRAERLPDRIVVHNPRSPRDPPVRF